MHIPASLNNLALFKETSPATSTPSQKAKSPDLKNVTINFYSNILVAKYSLLLWAEKVTGTFATIGGYEKILSLEEMATN